MSLRALVRVAFVVSTVSIGVLRAQDSGWILTNVPIVDDRLSRETYTQIAEAARARGLPVVGHLPGLVPIEDVIKERQRIVEHLGGLTHGILMACSHDSAARPRLAAALVPEDFARLVRVSMSAEHLTPLLDGFDAAQCTAVARRLREAEVWQVPTLLLWKAWASTGPGSSVELAVWQRLNRTMIDITRILHAERVPMMAGTDNIQSLHDELAVLLARARPAIPFRSFRDAGCSRR